jgi:hypothetical protein
MIDATQSLFSTVMETSLPTNHHFSIFHILFLCFSRTLLEQFEVISNLEPIGPHAISKCREKVYMSLHWVPAHEGAQHRRGAG